MKKSAAAKSAKGGASVKSAKKSVAGLSKKGSQMIEKEEKSPEKKKNMSRQGSVNQDDKKPASRENSQNSRRSKKSKAGDKEKDKDEEEKETPQQDEVQEEQDVDKKEEEKSAIGEKPSLETAPKAESINGEKQQVASDEIQPENQDEDDLFIKQNMTKETRGAGLADMRDEVGKSLAMTEKMKPQATDEKFFDPNQIDQFTEVDKNKDVERESNGLGLIEDDLDIQPKKINQLTNQQIEMISESWKVVDEIGSEAVGVLLFKNIFTIAPGALELFSFKDEHDLYESQKLKSHGRIVVETVGRAVGGLYDLESLIPVLRTLGSQHIMRGVLPEHYPVVRDALVQTLSGALGDKWNDEVELAWATAYKIISDTMAFGQNVDDAIAQAQADEEEAEYSDELTPTKIALIQATWNKVQSNPIADVGVSFFAKIFEIAPEALQLFPFRNDPNYLQGEALRVHATGVLVLVGKAVHLLNDLDTLVPILMESGKSHSKRGVKAEHFPIVGQALLETLEGGLGSLFTEEVRQCWTVAFKVLSDTMITGLEEDKKPEFPVNESTRQNDDSMRPFIQGQNSIMNDEGEALSAPKRGKTNQAFKDDVESEANQNTSAVKDHYLAIFRKEVDFHHKVAYRFEKAYRLGKKKEVNERRHHLNLEIIDCISEHSGYIEQDPMALFYCLFFCIYYKNEELVEFLRTLIHKIHSHEKIDKLLEYIDVNGIEKIRTVGEQINLLVYHMVFYQAVDDDLRIVYSQIFRQSRFIQLRDKDALQFLNQRDYELIRLSFEKYVTKISLNLFFKKSFPIKASTYRKYDQAYYEEIVINNDVESRVAQNYRERFLVTAEDIYIVFGMYCKEDYDEQFQRTPKDEITHKQFVELFIICLRNDSFKIAILIYTLYLQPAQDMDQKMMDILMSTIKESTKFHEMKLFFLHEHFDVLSISQMNQLIDIYQEILNVKDPRFNPAINQFNVIKIALLIYRICFKIELKQIYSLITKCSLLQSYLIRSLSMYFEKQSNILVLYKFMSEPILHMTERKDSLDIMYEMNMQELLKHPVVIEVLNLVYEGKYSVSSSELSMSQTFQCMLDMETMSLKSITERLIQTIVNFGDTNNSKQTSVQYNIWKQSIQQREKDEMRFTVLFCAILIGIAITINMQINRIFDHTKLFFTTSFEKKNSILFNAPDATLKEFCPDAITLLDESYQFVGVFTLLMIISTIGMISSFIQKIVIFRVKDNVSLNVGLMLLELSIAFTGISFIVMVNKERVLNTLNSDVCGRVLDVDPLQKDNADKMYTLLNPAPGEFEFRLLMSIIMIQLTCLSIIMLQRTQYLGELIMMLDQMTNELVRFFATFGLIIILFLLVGRMLSSELKEEHATFFQAFLDLFNAFNGNQEFEEFLAPTGQIYIGIFMYIFKVLLMSLLAAMFINKYKQVWKNLEAYRRFNIIRLKNSVAYDKFLGAVTITFFPINILMLPFIPPITILRSARASDFLLKLQYVIMILLYCVLACIMVVPIIPILYLKMLTNSIFISFANNREDYKGQNILNLLITAFFGLPIIAITILIDLLSLPNILLKDSKGFEHKYQLSTDRLNDAQIQVVMTTFGKIFYGQNFQNFKGKNMTLMDLMIMHRKIFSLVDNLHDLTCKGNKNYKESLSNVQDYNMTKILTRQASIPNVNGVYKDSKVELDVIFAIQFDIELYNYVDIVLRKLRLGKLYQESIEKTKMKMGSGEEEKKQEAKAEENVDEEDDETKKVDGVFPIGIGPDGVPLKRNNSDVMNNFFVNQTSRAFTDIEKILANVATNGENKRVERFKEEIKKQELVWEEKTVGAFNQQADKYEAYVKKEVGAPASGKDKKKEGDTSSGKDKKTTESTKSDPDNSDKTKKTKKTMRTAKSYAV